MIIKEKIQVTKGSDNVFEDLGFNPIEATNLKIKTDLMIELRSFILNKGWSQSEAAQFFNETQPRIINLMNLDITRFSVDELLSMVGKANIKVKLEIIY